MNATKRESTELRSLSRAEVRAIDRRAIEELHVPGIVLMENAGRGAAAWLAELGIDGPITVCCGKGNNGGDGYVVARHLDAWGYAVRVLSTAGPETLEGDARVNARIVAASGVRIERWEPSVTKGPPPALCEAAWIVDALLGTGARGELDGPLRAAVEAINACPAPKFAIDIPSGLDCDTGEPLGGAVRASHTATFLAPKLGFAAAHAAAYTGIVRVLDIGVPAILLRAYTLGEKR